jgi:2,4-dienoyl-CoA reductase-like NADH-dependent reductase (Old Yellow Enzyme family)
MPSLCPSVVPVKLADNFLERRVVKKLYGGPPKEMTVEEIDEIVGKFVVAAKVVKLAGTLFCFSPVSLWVTYNKFEPLAGFKAVAIHAAHGFLVSQFLSPYTNRRTDDYGGTPEKRLKFLQRIVIEVREAVGPDFCVGVKLNSGDYMKNDAGLMPDEAIEQVRWLLTCGLLDMCELSGGNAEGSQGSSRLACTCFPPYSSYLLYAYDAVDLE